MENVTIQGTTQRYRVFHGHYEFSDPSGRAQRGVHTSREALTTDEQVEVLHDPDDPSLHEPVARAKPVWAPVLALVFYTLCVGLFAGLTLGLGLGLE